MTEPLQVPFYKAERGDRPWIVVCPLCGREFHPCFDESPQRGLIKAKKHVWNRHRVSEIVGQRLPDEPHIPKYWELHYDPNLGVAGDAE